MGLIKRIEDVSLESVELNEQLREIFCKLGWMEFIINFMDTLAGL